jgi:hypothetical protein
MKTRKERFLERNANLCRKCGKPKINNAKHAWCKPCQAAYYQKRCEEPGYKELLAEKTRAWWAKQKELGLDVQWHRKFNLKGHRGISIEEYQRKWDKQHGLCAICDQPETTVKKGKLMPLYVDHNHATEQNRGLLCAKCNFALSRLEEIPLWHERALAYLAEWK